MTENMTKKGLITLLLDRCKEIVQIIGVAKKIEHPSGNDDTP